MVEMCGKIHFKTNQNSVEDVQLFNKLNPVNFWIKYECFVSIILITDSFNLDKKLVRGNYLPERLSLQGGVRKD